MSTWKLVLLFKNGVAKKNDPLNVAENYCDYSGVYDGGALQRAVLNQGLAGIESSQVLKTS